jgi:hypothetical protein
MIEKQKPQALKAEKVLKQVLSQRFTFEVNQADLELLRFIAEGNDVNGKPGDPSFHAYAATLNLANEFATQALDILELVPFNNQLADLQEKYTPSYPPMSPVTSAFFAGWMVLDARDSFTGLTLGEVFAHYLQHTSKMEYLRKAIGALNGSCCSFYEVTEVDSHGIKLRDIADEREVQSWNSSGYSGRAGEIWYVRLLPPFVAQSNRWVTMNTPYVFRRSRRQTWQAIFERYQHSEFGAGHSLREYLKHGKSLGYWLEFIFQAFEDYTGNMILVTGVPDNPASLPRSHPEDKL